MGKEYVIIVMDIDNCLIQSHGAHLEEKLPRVFKRAALAAYELVEWLLGFFIGEIPLRYNPKLLESIKQWKEKSANVRLMALTNRSAFGLRSLMKRDSERILDSFYAISVRRGIFDFFISPPQSVYLFKRRRIKPHRYIIPVLEIQLINLGVVPKEIHLFDDSGKTRDQAIKNGYKAYHPAETHHFPF